MSTPHQLCLIDPPAAVLTAVGPFPSRRSIGEPSEWTAPEGHHYLPIVEATPPAFDPETEMLSPLPDAIINGEFVVNRAEVVPLPAAPISLTSLDTAFETLVPAELQHAFEVPWTTVRNLIQAGKISRAAAFVRSLTVPEGLTSLRDQIADMIDGGQ